MEQSLKLKMLSISTEIGPMLAVADEEELYFLDFADRSSLAQKLNMLRSKINATIIDGETSPITSIKAELDGYFNGHLREFKTKFRLLGTPFQQSAWKSLLLVPYGETRSYADQAAAIGRQAAYRAVANANGANKLAIIVPCHRITNNNGNLGGYGGGLFRKKFLIEHERSPKTRGNGG